MERIAGYDNWIANGKCNEMPERKRHCVRLGERYAVYVFGEYSGIVTVNMDNFEKIEEEMNDPENDITVYAPLPERVYKNKRAE